MGGAGNYTGSPTVDDKTGLTRLWLGDRSEPYIFTDKEIELVLSVQPSPVQAAASLACARMAECARKVDKAIGRTKLSLSQEMGQWAALASKLEAAGSGDVPNQGAGVGGFLAGGLLRAEKEELQTNTTNVQFQFTIGQDDHPDTNSTPDDPDGT